MLRTSKHKKKIRHFNYVDTSKYHLSKITNILLKREKEKKKTMGALSQIEKIVKHQHTNGSGTMIRATMA
jgi:hypothetical protein